MSICVEQQSYKNTKYCSNVDKYSFVSPIRLTKWKLNQQIKLWKSRYRQRKALAKLDQRLLEDIGYSYLQAKQEIAKPFWK